MMSWSGPGTGEMWENQRAELGIFFRQIQTVVDLSKLGFPRSGPALMVSPLDHGLEAPCYEGRESCTAI
ncbi:MAG TPA: hypothetical protein VIM11_15365 [Tepidisphaeraceae bacterium]